MSSDRSDQVFAVEDSIEEAIQSRIRTLSEEVWSGVVQGSDVERWLGNFDGRVLGVERERLHALHLLANFDFFGINEVREMLKSLFRDLFRYPIIQASRKALGHTRDFLSLDAEFRRELATTRFLGMGNPSESGAHLLYYFRQVNKLPKSLFIHQHEIMAKAPGVSNNAIAIQGLKRLVFIDDLMGSGQQATEYSKKLLQYVRQTAQESSLDLEISYFTLFARSQALETVRKLPFDHVETVNELDDAEKAFDKRSRVYISPPVEITLDEAKRFAEAYGKLLVPNHPLGYKDGQLLMGFQHNVPDNSLPIFWLNEYSIEWEAVFPRYSKV
ncbi:hypothetical protein J4H92_10885 [Leucobacter weissii]|uniref:PRTase-CE domain-containing protein n=1 Tax=Leucobacter weissii TaxID=1983706 RepID=A0A939MKI8_9MICO|nr:hypothetical protein [Leucobacter weissii]MBO1902453.1 hypothetical protein [Leucobacter weissii]